MYIQPHFCICILFQEAVYYLLFSFLFRKAKGHQLYKLLSGDAADGRLVNERGVRVVCVNFGNCRDNGGVHYDGVTLASAAAAVVAVYA